MIETLANFALHLIVPMAQTRPVPGSSIAAGPQRRHFEALHYDLFFLVRGGRDKPCSAPLK